jgi:hypothetical protein
MLEGLLPEAEAYAARGAELVRAQEARVATLEGKGQLADQSKKLLAILRETQELHISHVELLKSELATAD